MRIGIFLMIVLGCLLPISAPGKPCELNAHASESELRQLASFLAPCTWGDFPDLSNLPEEMHYDTTLRRYFLNVTSLLYIARPELGIGTQATIYRFIQIACLASVLEYLHWITPCIKYKLVIFTAYKISKLIKNPLP